ncbi:MAG: ATP-dependent zinc protease, partial [Lentisphaeria bacterium]|nr:ATP-dependent zinc protease [Lentisphaeria bacterium]
LHEISIENQKYKCVAKLDSGADNCSMGATKITPFERDGKKWVRFDLDTRLTDGKKVTLEKKVIKTTEIVRHGQTPQKRFVVKLDFTIADIQQNINVSLTDRSGYSKAILVGRNFLNGYILVDSAPIKTEGK